ncbi:MAG TPA: twin-arginine translocation signal domain-containing protein, partial [candidate division Zixibacteria bacterium]|nr:twin-arginine translocation signal domain-containing protein [candidate division Zixibacteria bacterium]
MKIKKTAVTRRDFLKTGGIGIVGLAGAGGVGSLVAPPLLRDLEPASQEPTDSHLESHNAFGTVGTVDHAANGFDPMEVLYDFDYGEVKTEGGRTV